MAGEQGSREICRFYIAGKCRFGKNCWNIHPADISAKKCQINGFKTKPKHTIQRYLADLATLILQGKWRLVKQISRLHSMVLKLDLQRSVPFHYVGILISFITIISIDCVRWCFLLASFYSHYPRFLDFRSERASALGDLALL